MFYTYRKLILRRIPTDVDGTSNASLNNDTRELPTYKMPAPANDYKGILMRTAYAVRSLSVATA